MLNRYKQNKTKTKKKNICHSSQNITLHFFFRCKREFSRILSIWRHLVKK